jgi:radical SAM protein with 4Fe4S-binding SPASM domain
MNKLFFHKMSRFAVHKLDATIGRLYPLENTLQAMALRPFELHLELTNICNANCIFCPYQHQIRPHQYMSDEVFEKALADYVAEDGGSIILTPIVGDFLIDRKCIDRIRRARSFSCIDRIKAITNAILADRYGANSIVTSGITHLAFSIAGFDEKMYERVYRSKQYSRVYRNILDILEANHKHGCPVAISVGLRPDRPLEEVVAYPDFREVMKYNPEVDFTWSFTTAGGRIKRTDLPDIMRLRALSPKKEACVNTYNGPIVLPDGNVLACSCVAAVDAVEDLRIGNLFDGRLGDIWRSDRTRQLREDFGTEKLNPTCRKCDMYRNLDLYRSREGRVRAKINALRAKGQVVHRGRGSRSSLSIGG